MAMGVWPPTTAGRMARVEGREEGTEEEDEEEEE